MLEAILHEEVAERPRDAAAMMVGEFGNWCESIRVGDIEVASWVGEPGGVRNSSVFSHTCTTGSH